MKEKNPNAVSLGKIGGEKTKKRGKAYYSRIGKKGAKGRWKNGVDNGKKNK